jgi:prepilin-type N-terminal cleavage/methylation domain-containing protein
MVIFHGNLMYRRGFSSKTRQDPGVSAGFTLIELMIVVSVVIIMSAVAIPSFQSIISSRRLQAVAWQMVQDMRTVREDAILYQQDLNVYINYPNSPVAPTDPANKNNRSYLFETFQWGMDQPTQAPGSHYVPGDTANSHFTERVLQSGIIITSITSTGFASTQISSKNYWVVCFRCGSDSAFRGEADGITGNPFSQTQRTDPASLTPIGSGNLVITLQDPATDRTFNVIVKGTGEVSMGNS